MTNVNWWEILIEPLLVLALVVAAISVVTWHFSRPKAYPRSACPQCRAGVHHAGRAECLVTEELR